MSTKNPACTNGQITPDEATDGQYRAWCGCGWSEGGYASKSAAKAGQRAHRFPPREPAAAG